MKIQIYLLQKTLHKGGVQTQLIDSSHHINSLNVLPVASLKKETPHSEPTTLPFRVWNLELRADKKLWCKETGELLPSTPKGKIDKKKLAHEIAHKRLDWLMQ